MAEYHPEYVVDERNQRKAVVLPILEWEQLLEDIEELDDIRAYDETKKGPSDSIPFEQAVQEIRSGDLH